ncbi:MAG TPA: ABC transporter permease [Desulfohalobiaceae bacterium]|nr:ABC transporter permease [Desulfohalobiaceae bacterium]
MSENEQETMSFTFPEYVHNKNVGFILRDFQQDFSRINPCRVYVDFQQTKSFNDFGVLVLTEIKKKTHQANGKLVLRNLSQEVQDILDLVQFSTLPEEVSDLSQKRLPKITIRTGEAFFKCLYDMKKMIFFVGEVFFASLVLIKNPRKLRYNDVIYYMQRVGVDALPIVALISLLLGLIMAFMSSAQLEQFGANIYVASLVSLAMIKELGPIMTCILVSGRSGSAFASEIGSMKISEEVDALTTMGFDTTIFLVMPKIVAAVIVVPLLVVFSDIFAIAGGLIIGVSMLDLTIHSYIHQTMTSLTILDFGLGLLKSMFFALIIAWIGAFRGFQTEGGAQEVGQATTSAVVSSIFLIIVVDSLIAVMLRYWN